LKRGRARAAQECEDIYLAYARHLLSESREELVRADNKSALLLASSGIIVGAILAAILAGDWSPQTLAPCVAWIWWLGAAAGLGGIISFAYAVYPVTKYRGQRPANVVAYFGDVLTVPEADLQGRLRAAAQSSDARVVNQIRTIALIVDRKYRGIQTGLWCIAVGLTLCSASSIADWSL
jgi:hypothetical protein